MQEWTLIFLRTIVLFFLTLALVRLLGKRHPTRTAPFTFVSYVVLAVTVPLISLNIIQNFIYGVFLLVVWTLFPIVLDFLALKSSWVHGWIHGKEIILIKHGKVMEENLQQARMTGEDLLRELRSQAVFNLSDVEFAILETTGEINALLKADEQPLTPHDMEQKVAPQSESQTVILDGNILHESLANMGLNSRWLLTHLDGMGIPVNNVFIAQVDSSGDLYVDLFDDAIELAQPKVKELLYINLESAQADLMTFALDSDDPGAKEMYACNASRLEEVITLLRPYLLR